MRGQTRAPCPATTYLSWLSCEPKRCPLALDNLPLRRLTPLEVVWRSSRSLAHEQLLAAGIPGRPGRRGGGPPKLVAAGARNIPAQDFDSFANRPQVIAKTNKSFMRLEILSVKKSVKNLVKNPRTKFLQISKPAQAGFVPRCDTCAGLRLLSSCRLKYRSSAWTLRLSSHSPRM